MKYELKISVEHLFKILTHGIVNMLCQYHYTIVFLSIRTLLMLKSGSLLIRVLMMSFLIAGFSNETTLAAEENERDQFEGAIWRFSMKAKNGDQPELRGFFRLNNAKLYQKETPEDPDFSKLIGTQKLKEKTRTRLEFTDLRAANKDKEFREGIQGSIYLRFDRLGEWSGTLIDEKGAHWNFRCSRIQE
ncbi:MAG: hypothetical protein CMN21_03030 [Rubinisphaera sp.]|nr:hypothetical protein [Rubinisphaera sp.]